jgi:hypothetical protein
VDMDTEDDGDDELDSDVMDADLLDDFEIDQ